jgi:hypothetical protein
MHAALTPPVDPEFRTGELPSCLHEPRQRAKRDTKRRSPTFSDPWPPRPNQNGIGAGSAAAARPLEEAGNEPWEGPGEPAGQRGKALVSWTQWCVRARLARLRGRAFARNHDTPRFHPEKSTAFPSLSSPARALSLSLCCLDLSTPHWSIHLLSNEREREERGWHMAGYWWGAELNLINAKGGVCGRYYDHETGRRGFGLLPLGFRVAHHLAGNGNGGRAPNHSPRLSPRPFNPTPLSSALPHLALRPLLTFPLLRFRFCLFPIPSSAGGAIERASWRRSSS